MAPYLQPALKPPNNNIVPNLHTDVRIVGSIQPLLFADLLSSSYSSARETHPTKRLIQMQFDLLSQRIRLGRTAAKLFRSGEEIVQMAQLYGAQRAGDQTTVTTSRSLRSRCEPLMFLP